MIGIRKALALAALMALGGLIVLSDATNPAGGEDRWVVSFWGFLPPLLVTIVGLVAGVLLLAYQKTVFLPGVLMGWASLLRFGGSMLRYLREGDRGSAVPG